MSDPTTITVSAIEYPTPVGKPFHLDANGNLTKGKPKRPPEATAVHLDFKNFADFASWRRTLSSNTILMSGTFEGPQSNGAVVRYGPLANREAGEVAATKNFLAFRDGPGVAVLDFDVKDQEDVAGIFPAAPLRMQHPNELIEALITVFPELGGCALLATDSSSAMIIDANGAQLKGPSGIRIYVPVTSAAKIPDLLLAIQKRCWIAGNGWAFVDRAGRFQERSLVDLALAKPTQPDYAAPDLGEGLVQKRRWIEKNGGLLDAGSVSVFSPEDESAYAVAVNEARGALSDCMGRAKAAAKSRKVKELIERGIEVRRATKIANRLYENSSISGQDEIEFDDGTCVTAAELLARGEEYDGRECLDPAEPDYDGGRIVGKFFWNQGFRPGVFSFAHGGHWFHIHHDIESLRFVMQGADQHAIIFAFARTAFESGLDQEIAEREAAVALGLGNRRTSFRNAVSDEQRRMASFRNDENDADASESDDEIIAAGRWPHDQALPLASFPFIIGGGDDIRLVNHQENYSYLLAAYGIDVSYDVIRKTMNWRAPGLESDTDNADNALISRIASLAALNSLPGGKDGILLHLPAIAERHQINSVCDYISQLKWDGQDRFARLAESLSSNNPLIAAMVLRLWFIEACSAADGARYAMLLSRDVRPAYEYVLVFIGRQGIGKTKGLLKIIPRDLHPYLKESVVLSIGNKDSVKIAVSAWIVELGELDATFGKADQVQLKAFLSTERDEIRLPYAAAYSNFQRHTVFFGSCNEQTFLRDQTGNRRFFPLCVDHGFPDWPDEDVDQLWAQAQHLYSSGVQWWPNADEEAALAEASELFRQKTSEEEKIEQYFDFNAGPEGNKRMTISAIADKTNIFRADTPAVRDNIAKAFERLWMLHGARRENGVIVIDTAAGAVKIRAEGGKNPGFLVPPRPELGQGSPPNVWPTMSPGAAPAAANSTDEHTAPRRRSRRASASG
jgi:hypothetical protein